MKLSMNGAMQTKQKNQYVTGFSKSYEPGDITRVFYPIYWDEANEPQICIGVRCGHSVNDYNGLGLKTSFIPTLSPLDADYKPIEQDIAYKFSRSVAPAIWAGQYKAEEDQINEKNWPSEEMKKEALKTLDIKYDAKNNMKAIRPIISRFQMLILTEPMVCKVTNGRVNTDTAKAYVQKISGDLHNKLNVLLHDAKYAPEPGSNYFEVEYVYPQGSDKTQAGKTLPSGLTAEYRLHLNDPEAFSKLKGFLGTMTTDDEVIASHFAKPVEESRIIQSFTNYTFMNSQYLDKINSQTDDAKNIIEYPEIIEELHIVNSLNNVELAAALREAVMSASPSKANETQNTDEILESMAASAMTEVEKIPVLDELVSKPNAVLDADVLSGIDFAPSDLNA